MSDKKMAFVIALWLFLVPAMLFLAWASLHGFDPSMCEAHHQCAWRNA